MGIDDMINNEIERAKKPPFVDMHQAYAVILEEWEETKSELMDIETGIQELWAMVKKDKDTSQLLYTLEIACVCALGELLQVAAMIRKGKQVNGNG